MITKRGSMSLFALLLIATIGCSTVMHGFRQDVPIKTEPAGLSARIGDETCITPCSLFVSRHNKEIVISENGKNEKKYDLDRHFNWAPYIFGNAITFWIPGMIIDKISGADYTINPVNLDARAEAEQQSTTATAGAGK